MKRSMNRAKFVRFTPVVAALLSDRGPSIGPRRHGGRGRFDCGSTRSGPCCRGEYRKRRDMWIGHVGIGWLGTVAVPVVPSPRPTPG